MASPSQAAVGSQSMPELTPMLPTRMRILSTGSLFGSWNVKSTLVDDTGIPMKVLSEETLPHHFSVLVLSVISALSCWLTDLSATCIHSVMTSAIASLASPVQTLSGT